MVENTAMPFYEIRIRGVLGAALIDGFPRLAGVREGVDTVLSGQLPDQAALFGVLSQIESLGLELLGVHQVGRT